jgi:hypothetical protein
LFPIVPDCSGLELFDRESLSIQKFHYQRITLLYLTNSQNKRCLQIQIRPSTAYSKTEEECDSMFAYDSLLEVVGDLEWTLVVERKIDCDCDNDCDCFLDSAGTDARVYGHFVRFLFLEGLVHEEGRL